jgi:23S rRNA pseudouridine1911/1915/1917 synthase
MAHIGHPLVGDSVYGPARNAFGLTGQALHASTLGFVHPFTRKYMEFTAPLPEELAHIVNKLSCRTFLPGPDRRVDG